MQIKGRYYYQTSIGNVRDTNEDEAIVLTNPVGDVLMLVCDGMGGHQKGDVASKMTIELIAEAFRKKQKFFSVGFARLWLSRIIKKANKKVHKLANLSEEFHGMGTTIVAVLIRGDQFIVANMGDSRAYEVFDDKLVQKSEDHTYVEHLYRTGKITKEEMLKHPKRNIITNALGIYPTVNLAIAVHKFRGKGIMLCSDGLYCSLKHDEMFALLTVDETIEAKCEYIIKRVNTSGGSDNSAIALWEVIL